MIEVINLVDQTSVTFDDTIDPKYAVQYCQAAYVLGNLDWFYNAPQSERDTVLPVTEGRISVACGDWATFL